MIEKIKKSLIFLLRHQISLLAIYIWFHYTSRDLKLRGFFYALSFSVIEFSWYSTTTVQPNGELKFTPFASTCRKGFTTFAMFCVNLIYTPFMIDRFYESMDKYFYNYSHILKIILFPFSIWLGVYHSFLNQGSKFNFLMDRL
jgi:hypothetical protein